MRPASRGRGGLWRGRGHKCCDRILSIALRSPVTDGIFGNMDSVRRFFAWYPSNSSPPGILGDLLVGMLNVIGFSWEASPAATELEVIVLGELLSSFASLFYLLYVYKNLVPPFNHTSQYFSSVANLSLLQGIPKNTHSHNTSTQPMRTASVVPIVLASYGFKLPNMGVLNFHAR